MTFAAGVASCSALVLHSILEQTRPGARPGSIRCRNWDGSGESQLAADVKFNLMLNLAANDASGVDVSETLLEALAPANRDRVRYGNAARFDGLRRLADAAAPAA
jgi:hypothetical protein